MTKGSVVPDPFLVILNLPAGRQAWFRIKADYELNSQ
jgi:hypothetical protein